MLPESHNVCPGTIPSLFREVALANPDRDAVCCGDVSYTYSQLDVASDGLATELINAGVCSGARVGVAGVRCPEMILSLLAVAKAGAVAVPLDPDYPAARLQFLVSDAGLRMLLDFSPGHDVFKSLNVAIKDPGPWREQSCPVPVNFPLIGPGDPAYVTYTSGSTGTPKGVECCHSGIVTLARDGGVFDWSAPQCLLHITSLSFDLAQFEIWGALLNGATLALLPERPTHLRVLGETLRRHGVTIINITTALFHRIADEDPGILRGVRQVLVGGEALSPRHIRAAMAALPGLRFVNAYGPTESTVIATFFELPPDFPTNSPDVPIGKPVPGTTALVVDAMLKPVAQGAVGELLLGGAGLARGYLGRPELTAEKFVFLDGTRFYRTGDMVRCDTEGQLHFLGRLDGQVKVRGFRIEPGEVESVLLRHPAVRRSVVVVKNEQLVAYVVAASDTGANAESLRSFVAEELPPHLVPSAVVFLENLPLTLHGKIDAASLPDPVPVVATTADTPATGLEASLLAICKDVVGVAGVGVETPFGEMGASSMHLAQIHHRLEQMLGRHLAITDLFQYPTIRSLAAFLDPQNKQENRVGPSRADLRRQALARMRR